MLAPKTRIPLNVPSYGEEEIAEVVDSLRSTYVTMGKKVKRFEEMWAEYIGVKHAIMTNSGSSANLLLLSAMEVKGEIITPALTWATTVFPIVQTGSTPVLIDVDPKTYNVDPDAIRAAITRKTTAIMLVHLLGNPCDMDAIMQIAHNRMIPVIEDSCEAHGAEWKEQKTGSFGDAATFSFFFSHHISTIEGGMVVTNNSDLADRCRSMRGFGWIRELPGRDAIAAQNPHIDPRFLFAYPGFNMRPMDLQGAIGIHQVPKLEGFIKIRRENAAYWNKEFAKYENWLVLPHERPNTRHVSFAYAVTVKPGTPFTKKELQGHLEAMGVETRPIEAGNMACQPAMERLHYRTEPLPNAEYIHANGFFFGNHHGIGRQEREAVAGYFHEFMGRYL